MQRRVFDTRKMVEEYEIEKAETERQKEGVTEDINLRSSLIKGAPLGNGSNLGPFRSRNEEKPISMPICLLRCCAGLCRV